MTVARSSVEGCDRGCDRGTVTKAVLVNGTVLHGEVRVWAGGLVTPDRLNS